MYPKIFDQRGFSIVEIVAVTLIVAILAAVAIPRLSGSGDIAARTSADRLLAALQYAQMLAQQQGVPTSVVIGGGKVSVQQNGTPVQLALDGTTGYTFDVPSDISISSPTPCSLQVDFAWDGSRTSNIGTQCNFSVLESGATRFIVRLETTGYAYLIT